MTRAVLDANILISAVIKKGGKPYQVTYLAPDRFDWLTSEFILSEVAGVLTRKHIQTKYRRQVTAKRRRLFFARVRSIAVVVDVKTELSVVPDAKDNPVLACAVDGQADYLVTGDPHLLRMQSYENIQIVTPDEFLRILP